MIAFGMPYTAHRDSAPPAVTGVKKYLFLSEAASSLIPPPVKKNSCISSRSIANHKLVSSMCVRGGWGYSTPPKTNTLSPS